MTQRHLAKKVQQQWDLNLVLGNLEFLGLPGVSPLSIKGYVQEYLDFRSTRKSGKAWTTTSGILQKFTTFLDEQGIRNLEDITVKSIDRYIDWLDRAPNTKRNHLLEISLMLDQAVKEDILKTNPAKRATLPRMVKEEKHRPLEPADLWIIWKGAGSWKLFYSFLLHTGLRCGDVALLTYGNINWSRQVLVSFIRKSRRIYEFPLAEALVDLIPKGRPREEPLFPALYVEHDDEDRRERILNDKLAKPRKYMQALLAAGGRPRATLHSFRTTFNNSLRDLGMSIEDRQVLLAHASSETTRLYTHPNIELARELVNRIPDPDNLA
ncbi:MAG: tyrosine-type recombinase/integrase [Desulfobacterales bacterium]|nr:tyrosine-type recombinase/integrase [Desulfobacterales bacterium]